MKKITISILISAIILLIAGFISNVFIFKPKEENTKLKQENQQLLEIKDSLLNELNNWNDSAKRIRKIVGLPENIILTDKIKQEIIKQKHGNNITGR
jgi:hypothetical protein